RTARCFQHQEKSINVLEGTNKDQGWFAYVCSLDEGDDWTNPKVWPKANPSLGTVLPVEYLERQVREAQTMPSKENIVKRLNFCVWTEHSERWLNIDLWDQCGKPANAVLGASCVAGLKLASRRDLVSCVLVFGPDEAGAYDIVPKFWIPREALVSEGDRAEADRLMLRR